MRRQRPKDGLVKGSEGHRGFALGPEASASWGSCQWPKKESVELHSCMCRHNYVTTYGLLDKCMYACIYIYMYICMYMHMYIYICIYIH